MCTGACTECQWKLQPENVEKSDKIKFAGKERTDFVAMTTILDHNFGYQEASILKALHIDTTALERSLEIQEHTRIKKKAAKIKKKKVRKIRKTSKEYAPGQF